MYGVAVVFLSPVMFNYFLLRLLLMFLSSPFIASFVMQGL